MGRNNSQNKDAPPKEGRKRKKLITETIILQDNWRFAPFKLSKLLQDETKIIMDLLNCGIGYLAVQSELVQDEEYYKAVNSLILARDKYKTLINVEISISLRREEG